MLKSEQMAQHKLGLKTLVEQGKAAERLAYNKDFKKLILQEYLIDNVARLVGQSTDLVNNAEQRHDALIMAQGASQLKHFLRVTVQLGEKAAQDLEGIDDMINEMEREEAEREEEDRLAAEAENQEG